MSNPLPAVKLGPFTGGAQTTAPVEGDDGFATLVPLAEPLSVGVLPVRPAAVASVAVSWPVRRVGVRAGYVVTGSLDVATRPRWVLHWPVLTAAERALLVAFFDDAAAGPEGTRRAFTLEPDGTGAGGTSVTVRAVGPVVFRHIRGVGSKGIHAVGEVTVEQVWA